MPTRILSLLILIAAAPALSAQSPAEENPLSAALARSFNTVANHIVASAEQFPEDKYAFRASPDVRTFAEEIAHVSDAHFAYCSRARNERSPQSGRIEGTLTDKPALVAKLIESVTFCRETYAAMTDSMLTGSYQIGNATGVRAAPLLSNATHDNEHYGKIVTYLRMNGIVPPSSQRP